MCRDVLQDLKLLFKGLLELKNVVNRQTICSQVNSQIVKSIKMEIINYEYKKIDNQDVIAAIEPKAANSGVAVKFSEFREQLFCEIAAADIKKFCGLLNNDSDLSFEYIKCLTAVDYIEYLEMVYCLYSFKNNWSINIKVKLDAEKPAVDSIYFDLPGR